MTEKELNYEILNSMAITLEEIDRHLMMLSDQLQQHLVGTTYYQTQYNHIADIHSRVYQLNELINTKNRDHLNRLNKEGTQ